MYKRVTFGYKLSGYCHDLHKQFSDADLVTCSDVSCQFASMCGILTGVMKTEVCG